MVNRAATLIGSGAALFALRAFYRNWGTTKGECALQLPGDDIVHAPAVQTTEGVWVHAPAAIVWMELQRVLQSCERFGRRAGITMRLAGSDGATYLVLRSTTAGIHQVGTWSIQVTPRSADHCRVLLRSRIALRHPGQVIGVEAAGPTRALVTGVLLRIVRSRAERVRDSEPIVPSAIDLSTAVERTHRDTRERGTTDDCVRPTVRTVVGASTGDGHVRHQPR